MEIWDMGEGTLMEALEALDRLEEEVCNAGRPSGYANLSIARRVLRSQALLLARASGALKASRYVTPTRSAIIADIAAMLPQSKDSSVPFVADLDEERPVPGPTPNRPEDRIQG